MAENNGRARRNRGQNYAFILLILFATNNSFGSSPIFFGYRNDEINWQFMPISWNLSYSEEGKLFNGFTVGLFDLYLEEVTKPLGFKITPIQYHYFQNNHAFNLVSITSYFDIFNINAWFLGRPVPEELPEEHVFRFVPEGYGGFLLGPFITFDFPMYASKYGLTYALNYGLRFTVFTQQSGLGNALLISIEGGRRNINRKNSYYFSVETSSFWFLLFATFIQDWILGY